MKPNIIIYTVCFVFFFLTACSEDDNYDGPDAGIRGAVIDDITNEPIQTEQPNGIIIRMLETKYAAPTNIDFWVKPNGTFENSKMFSGTYSMRPVDGAFFEVEAQGVEVKGTTEVNFTVTPLLALSASVTASTGSISATYKILRTRVHSDVSRSKITESKLLVASIPTVSNTIFDQINGANKVAVRNLNASPDQAILATEYTDVVSGLQSGKTYYARVAVRTAGLAKYNYSKVFEVKVP